MQRFLSLVIDFAFLSAFFFPITRLVKGVWLMTPGDHIWSYGFFVTDPLCLSFLIVIVFYFVLLEGLAGATVGKWLVGIRVADLSGKKPGIRRSLIRNVLRIVDSLPALNVLGVVLILKSDENARFGDRIAETRVIAVR